MKKRLSIILILIISIMLVGCGSDEDIQTDDDVITQAVEKKDTVDEPVTNTDTSVNTDINTDVNTDVNTDPVTDPATDPATDPVSDDPDNTDDETPDYYADENGNPLLYDDYGEYLCTIYLPGGFRVSNNLEDMTQYDLTDDLGGYIIVTAGATLDENFGYIEEEGEASVIDGFQVYTYEEAIYVDREFVLGVDGNEWVYLVTQRQGEPNQSYFYTKVEDKGVRIWLSEDVTDGFEMSDYIYLYNKLMHDEAKYSGFSHEDIPESEPTASETAGDDNFALDPDTGKQMIKNSDGDVIAEFSLPEGYALDTVQSNQSNLLYTNDGHVLVLSYLYELPYGDSINTGEEIDISGFQAFRSGDEEVYHTLVYLGNDNGQNVFFGINYD